MNPLQRTIFAFIKKYFRLEVSGWERVPKQASMIVGIHGGGTVCYDAWALGGAWVERFGKKRVLHTGIHDMLMRVPGLGHFAKASGCINPTKENITKVFQEGKDFLIFPGGDVDACRLWTERDKVVLGGRTGFVRLAIRNQVPIVPVATIGGHDTLFIVSEGRGIAKAINAISPKLKKFLRTERVPIALGIPFGVTLPVPLANFPLPAKIRIKFMPAIHLKDASYADDEEYVHEIYMLVKQRIASGIAELAKERKFPIFG